MPDWRPGIYYRNIYSAHKELGGGVDIDLIHEWDYMTYLFGMPSSVKHFSGKVSKLDINSCDYAVYIAQYGNSMISELHLDYFGRENIRTIELFMDDETVRGDFLAGTIEYLKAGKKVKLPAERDIYQKRELQYFLNAINKAGSSENDVN
ncbi:MAG: gfo/Idh/MocA family oxidoreductase, partial [Anaerovibrio sp.]|nr:gfo/Idh/MocA family oxidoreductase [Anaerovibrio sp.]